MLVPLESSSTVLVIAVLVTTSSKSVPVCNGSHARRVNSSKIYISWGVSLLMPLFEVNVTTQQHEIWSQETRDSTLSYSVNPESLS